MGLDLCVGGAQGSKLSSQLSALGCHGGQRGHCTHLHPARARLGVTVQHSCRCASVQSYGWRATRKSATLRIIGHIGYPPPCLKPMEAIVARGCVRRPTGAEEPPAISLMTPGTSGQSGGLTVELN